MKEYAEIKVELLEIAKVLERYPDALKPAVYELLMKHYLGGVVDPETKVETPAVRKRRDQDRKEVPTSGKAPLRGRKPATGESYQIDRELNLRGDKSIPAFKAFVEEKQPKGAQEFNAVSIYYLRKLVGLSPVTFNHIYTCYSEVHSKPPTAFRQSFTDAKNKKGLIDIAEDGTLDIPHRGSVFVEHDLPHKKAAKATE